LWMHHPSIHSKEDWMTIIKIWTTEKLASPVHHSSKSKSKMLFMTMSQI